MTETPTPYDKIQDDRLDQLESLITAEYQPPAGTEYSFPVANQGITQEQFRLMNLGQANGMIHGDNGTVNDSPDSTGYRYYLDKHDSDAETNQRNTLILRAGSSAESIVEGFYHRLTEDMELPFPPVTTTTVYHVTITYDPRDFKTSPLRIQVYPGEPPTSHGRVHLLLHTVERRPSELLTQATRTRYRPYTAGIVAVQNNTQLPDPGSYPAGTLAVTSGATHSTRQGIYVRSNTTKDWHNLLVGEWQSFGPHTGNEWAGDGGAARRAIGGVDVFFDINRGNAGGSPTAPMFNMPDFAAVSKEFYSVTYTSTGPRSLVVSPDGLGRGVSLRGDDARPAWTRGHFFIPDYFLRTP